MGRTSATRSGRCADGTREVDACIAWSGARPVEWLLDHVGVDRRWCLIHSTHFTDTETDRLAASGVVAGLCLITEANLGDGIRTPASLIAGIRPPNCRKAQTRRT